MALNSKENKIQPNRIPILDIGPIPVKTRKEIGDISTHSGDNLVDRSLRWELVFEAQLHVDWEATTAATKREGSHGVWLYKSKTHIQDMQNLIIEPLTSDEKEELRRKLKESSPNLTEKQIIQILRSGKVIGVRYKNSPGRKNKRVFVYKYCPERIFENMGYRNSMLAGTLIFPHTLMFSRKDVREFRKRVNRQYGIRSGEERICYFCKENFISRKKQEEPYVCAKSRCRKAKQRMKEKTLFS